MGRLVRDPEVRYSQGENSIAIARYTLAVDRPKRKGQESQADFINCVALGKPGKFAEMYLHQGMKIAVVGSWQTGSYVNKDGKKVYTNECLVIEHEFCESKESSSGAAAKRSDVGSDGFMNIPDGIDEELPFN